MINGDVSSARLRSGGRSGSVAFGYCDWRAVGGLTTGEREAAAPNAWASRRMEAPMSLKSPSLAQTDPDIARLIDDERERQRRKIRLIPSENYVSRAVLDATGSELTNKYSEGYVGKRYYEGQQVVDQVEALAIERAKAVFGVDHANVQPYSGSPANL